MKSIVVICMNKTKGFNASVLVDVAIEQIQQIEKGEQWEKIEWHNVDNLFTSDESYLPTISNDDLMLYVKNHTRESKYSYEELEEEDKKEIMIEARNYRFMQIVNESINDFLKD